MANLAPTPASVVASAYADKDVGIAGATIAAGDVLYKDASDSNKLKLAQSDGSLAEAQVAGIALNGGGAGQPIHYVKKDPQLTIGATMTAGIIYILSATPGKIAPSADILSGDYATVIGVPKTTALLNFNPTNGATELA
jgi:hypothetical protein